MVLNNVARSVFVRVAARHLHIMTCADKWTLSESSRLNGITPGLPALGISSVVVRNRVVPWCE